MRARLSLLVKLVAAQVGGGSVDSGWRVSLMIALPFPMLALVLGMVLEGPSGQSSLYDTLAYPIVIAFLLLIEGLLLFRRTEAQTAVLWIIAGSALFFMSKLVYLLFFAPAGVSIPAEMTETLFWAPSIYVLSSYVPGVRGGRLVATAFFLGAAALSVVYAVPNLLAARNYDVIYALSQLNLANVTLLFLTYAFIGYINRFIRHQAHTEAMERLAYTDVLTELPNRLLVERELEAALSATRREDGRLALLFVDVDGFKLVNDTMGHETGDRLLRDLADRLRRYGRREDVIGRISGDEFVFIARDVNGETEAVAMAQRLLQAVAEPFRLDDQLVSVTVSIGVALYPDDADDAAALLRHADNAMYQVKRSGKNAVKRFEPEFDAVLERRKRLERDLRGARARGEFRLHYQPVFDLEAGRMSGVEALLRWRHPEHGNVPPDQFIPLAEGSGLILEIGGWVLDQACAQLHRWHRAGHGGLRVAINVSPLQFAQADFVESVAATLARHHLPPGSLEIELTEGIVMQKLDSVKGAVAELQALGVSVAIDDFGTGYSSLSYLRDLTIDTLKIDRSFVDDLGAPLVAPQYSLALVQAIIGIAHTLDLKIVAEGVETEAQLQVLRGLGCHLGQGYLFARPMPPEDLAPMLDRATHAHPLADAPAPAEVN